MSMLAIIPARKNSKGIIGKSINGLRGKPLIARSILAAKGSKKISRIIVSMDSEQIVRVALSC
jgi:CMP-N,N'-diacetyllegionaminic acid synthase